MDQKYLSLTLLFLLSYRSQVFVKGEPIYSENPRSLDILTAGSVPSHVGLITDNNGAHLCTGSLVSKNHVLTVASCWEATAAETDLRVIFQTTDQQSIHRLQFNVLSKITYEQWCKNRPFCFYEKYTDDVGILTLDVDDTGITPAGLINYSFKVGDDVSIVGWGSTKDIEKPKTPRRALLTVMQNEECERRVREIVPPCFSDVVMSPKMSCAIAVPTTLGMKGDFGSPVRRKGAKRMSGLLVQRCPQLYDNDINSKQVNLILHLGHYEQFIYDVIRNLWKP